MKDKTYIRSVNIKDLWQIFIKRLWVMVLVAAILVAAVFAIKFVTFVPQYSSTATLYILHQNEDQRRTAEADSEFSLALKVVNDCTYLLKSHAVVDDVIDELGLDISYEELSGDISTNNPENTRILEVTVVSDTPENAKRIVDSLCEIGQAKITDAMGFQQVNLYEHGTLNTKPSNSTGILTYILIGIVAAIIVYFIFLVAFLLDDKIRTEDDIDRFLGLTVLGEIPDANEVSKNHYGGYYTAYGNRGSRSKNGSKKGEKK